MYPLLSVARHRGVLGGRGDEHQRYPRRAASTSSWLARVCAASASDGEARRSLRRAAHPKPAGAVVAG